MRDILTPKRTLEGSNTTKSLSRTHGTTRRELDGTKGSVLSSTRSVLEAARTSEALKSQLVTLSLEIEDRVRAADLIREAIDSEHDRHEDLVKELEEGWATKLEETKAAQSRELGERVGKIEQLLSEKQRLTGRCKELLERIKVEEEETAAAVEEVRKKCAAELQRAYDTWGEGEVARRERWVAKKTEEIRASTVKGLEPEIQRIMDTHKADMMALEAQQQDEERALRQQMSGRLEEVRDAATQRSRSKAAAAHEAERASFAAKTSKLGDEHMQHLSKVRGRLAAEKDAQRKVHVEEVQRLQDKHEADLAKLQNTHQERLKGLREKLQGEKEALGLHQQTTLAGLQQQAVVEREEWEACMRAKVGEDRDAHVEKERARLARMRDAEIEKTIHQVQTENVVFEKRCMAASDALRRQAKEQHEDAKATLLQECDELLRQQAEYSARHHQATEALARVRHTLHERTTQLKQLEEELKRTERAVKAAEKELAAETVAMVEREKKAAKEAQGRIDDFMGLVAKSEKDLQALEAEKGKRMKQVDRDHESVLHGLHLEVKKKVDEADAEIARIRDVLATERVKRSHLDKLLEQYQTQAVTAEGAPTGAATQRRNKP